MIVRYGWYVFDGFDNFEKLSNLWRWEESSRFWEILSYNTGNTASPLPSGLAKQGFCALQ